MAEKYVMLSLENEQSKYVAEVLGNKTCKRILKFLAENESSESDIAQNLKMNLNTVEYNLNKLIKAGFIVKSKKFFWSKKGKKIDVYKIASKSILISPKKSLAKSLIPVAVISGALAYLISFFSKPFVSNIAEKTFEDSGSVVTTAGSEVMGAVADSAPEVAGSFSYLSSYPVWAWFLLGAWLALIIFLILNWRRL